VVLDAETDVQDAGACFWRAVNRVRPERDLLVDNGRLAIDATGSDSGQPVVAKKAIRDLLDRRWREYGIEP
jgi:3-polyprenyl-4-hydroxybenzoate decarboxylase